MLNDVGITVPKLRETSAVLYAARQGMRACNNNNMRNLKLKDVLCMLLLLHAHW